MPVISHALIMAAGRGTRMMPLTDVIPKAMAPYDGSTLIAKGIAKLSHAIPKIHITVGYKGAILAQHVIENSVSTVFNTEGKDNSWWVFNTLMRYLDEPIFVLTCDNIIELDFDLLAQNYFDEGAPACMVVPVVPLPGLEGDYIYHIDHRVYKLSRTEPADIYCSGIQVLNPRKINDLIAPQDNFYSLWNELIKINQLYCSKIYPKKWFTVDTMAQLADVNKQSNLGK